MKNNPTLAKTILVFAFSAFALASCGGKTPASSKPLPSSSGEVESKSSETATSVTRPDYSTQSDKTQSGVLDGPKDSSSESASFDGVYTVRFETFGGTEIPAQTIEEGGKVMKPADPERADSVFLDWCVDVNLTSSFDFDTEIHSDYTLYAKYEGGGTSSSIGGDTDPTKPYGPDGASTNNWALVGDGTPFSSAWSVEGGIALYDNPGNALDKGCILNVSFAPGDLFKVTDGANWFGYATVESSEDPANWGRSHFADDGTNNHNILCTEAAIVDIYVNQYGNIWIQEHAA